MMIEKRVDAPFLSKFNRDSIYLKSENDLFNSIINEIGNILSTKLKTKAASEDSPFGYGVSDLQSLENSEDSLNEFKLQCRKAILRFEPRIDDVIISNCHFNKLNQCLELEISCQLKNSEKTFSSKFSMGN